MYSFDLHLQRDGDIRIPFQFPTVHINPEIPEGIALYPAQSKNLIKREQHPFCFIKFHDVRDQHKFPDT